MKVKRKIKWWQPAWVKRNIYLSQLAEASVDMVDAMHGFVKVIAEATNTPVPTFDKDLEFDAEEYIPRDTDAEFIKSIIQSYRAENDDMDEDVVASKLRDAGYDDDQIAYALADE